MNEPTLTDLLTRTADRIEPNPAPIAVMVANDQRRRNRLKLLPAVAAAAVVVAVVAGFAFGGGGSDRAQPAEPPTPTPGTTLAENRELARAESARLIESVQVPPGAEQLPGQPEEWRRGSAGIGPSDVSLSKTAWYAVEADEDEVGTFLRDHAPDGLTTAGLIGTSAGVVKVLHFSPDRSAAPTNPMAFRVGGVTALWTELSGRTVIRFQTFLAAREVRPAESFVRGEVASIDIGRTVTQLGGGTSVLPDLHVTRPADSRTIDRLATLVKNLPGTVVDTGPTSGFVPAKQLTTYTLTMHTEAGELAFQVHDSSPSAVTVFKDGQELDAALDPEGLASVLAEITRDPDLKQSGTLTGTWEVRALVGRDGQSVLTGRLANRVRMTFRDGQMTGTTGCNDVFGSYVQPTDGDRALEFPHKDLGSTLVGCSDEPPLVTRLLDVRHLTGSGDVRFLHAGNWMIVAQLVRAD